MTPTKLIVTLAAAVAVVGFAAEAVAQKTSSKRDQMMEKCLMEAGKVPGDLQQMTRTAIYKACMAKAGFKP